MGRRKAWPVQDSIASAARLAVGEEVFGIHKPGAINEVRDFVGGLFDGRIERQQCIGFDDINVSVNLVVVSGEITVMIEVVNDVVPDDTGQFEVRLMLSLTVNVQE